jgi:hypothetical protein
MRKKGKSKIVQRKSEEKSEFGSLMFLRDYSNYALIQFVATLALGLRPMQRFVRLHVKKEARGSHLMFLGVQKSVKE